MGKLFRSFDESWSYFLSRREPLESFLDGLPEDEGATAAVWLIALDPALTQGVRVLQDRLSRFDWLRPLPAHFLHVTVATLGLGGRRHDVPTLLEQGREALRGAGRFRLAFPRLNCFHEAVVAEVEGDGIHDAAERLRGGLDSFLPHLSLAYTTEPGRPEELRESLATLRATHLGEQEVREVLLCLVPASRATILEPWTVAGRATLD